MQIASGKRNLPDLAQPIRGWAVKTPAAPAVGHGSAWLSYAELEDRVSRCAAFLADRGVTDHEVCALDITDKLLYVICWFALFRLQVASTGFDPDTPPARKDQVAGICAVGAVISDRAPTMAGPQQIHVDHAGIEAFPVTPQTGLKRGSSRYAMLIAGSGTTGAPKMIAVGFDAIIASAPTESAIWGLGRTDVTYTTVQPWLASVVLRIFNTLHRGGAFLVSRDDTLDFFDAMEKARVNKIFAAVVHAEGMVGHARTHNRRLPDGTELTIYASVVTDGLISRIKENLTDKVRIVYGANELGVLADLDLSSGPRPMGSVGRVSRGAQVEIVDDDGVVQPADVAGHVRARAPRLFSEYVGEPEETARVLRDGWFYPGDIAKLDEQGHLILLGRSDQMMIFDGLNIYPAEIETVMSTHPAIADVAVMPMKHEIHQDVPICAAVRLPDTQVSERDLRDFAVSRLGARAPARVFLLDRIPRNGSGKIIRDDLAAILSARIQSGKAR